MTTRDHIAGPASADPPKPADEPASELAPIDPERYAVGRELAKTATVRVVEARDRRHDRAVAVKQLVVRSPDRRARFEREARILARLQHPSIASVLEVGIWPGGDPCIVMKLVTGERLDQLIAREPTLADRMGLLPRAIAVIDAIAYAHARNVLHRDLHPSNVLAGELGETVVVGWGLVKELSEPAGPASGPVLAVGTRPSEAVDGVDPGAPAYAPVEQLTGKPVDSRADVYALGALLYHVIAGVPPYTALAPELIAQAVIAGPPPAIDRQLGAPRELVAIVERAMARDPADRYSTARELAEAVAQFHGRRMVGREVVVGRGRRRRRIALAVAAGAVAAGAGVVAVRGLVAERDRLEEERAAMARDRERAEEVASFALADLRAKLAPIGKLELLQPAAKKAADYYAARAGQPQPQALVGLGDLLKEQGDLAGALAQYQAALALVAGSEPAAVATAHQRVAEIQLRRGDFGPAMVGARTSIDLALAMVKRDPKSVVAARSLALGKLLVGRVLAAQGKTAGALIELRAGLAGLEKIADDRELAAVLAENQVHVGDVLAAAKDSNGAIAQYQASLSIRQRLATADPASTTKKHELAAAYRRVGTVLEAQGHVNNALNTYKKAKTILLVLVAGDPGNGRWQADLERAHLEVARTSRADGNVVAAIADQRAALAIAALLAAREPTSVPVQRELAGVHEQLGDMLWEQGDKPGALDALRDAIAVADAAAKLGKDEATERIRGVAHATTGAILLSRGDTVGALASYQACAATYGGLRGEDDRRALAHAYERMADVLRIRRDLAGAITQQRKALEIAQQLAPSGRDVAVAYDRLGDLQLGNRELKATVESYRAALAVLEGLHADHEVARQHDKLADPLLMLNEVDAALVELRAALEIRERLAAANGGDVAVQVGAIKAHERLSDGLIVKRDLAGSRTEARIAFAGAMKIAPKLPPLEAQQLVLRLRWKAMR